MFFDTNLSGDKSISCASCHNPQWAFTDRQPISRGINGNLALRNSISLLNVADAPTLMFDAHISSLEEQALVPIRDTNEMGVDLRVLLTRLNANPNYVELTKKGFQKDTVDLIVVTRALAGFQRTLIAKNSKYDQFKRGEVELTLLEQKGKKIFDRLNCVECHSGENFTNYQAENNGMVADLKDDLGRFRIHLDSSDIGKFRVPSLRNIELTAPYFHDGSVPTLDSLIDLYVTGGNKNANQSDKIQPFSISEQEKEALILFLKTLTDTSYIQSVM